MMGRPTAQVKDCDDPDRGENASDQNADVANRPPAAISGNTSQHLKAGTRDLDRARCALRIAHNCRRSSSLYVYSRSRH